VAAVCTKPTSVVDAVRLVISQAAPTDCIKVPILDTVFAAQMARNAGSASGASNEWLGSPLVEAVAALSLTKKS
jgi:hypothetical protein